MIKFISVTLLVFLALVKACIAVNSMPIEGEATGGWKVFIDTENVSSLSISTWKRSDQTGETSQEFLNEPCAFDGDFDGGSITFSCAETAKSPLAGTTYIGHKSAECGVDYQYDCVAGCKKNGHTPLTLTQGYYEGGPDLYCGMSDKEREAAEQEDAMR
ncbi:MAG: hypothetical protein ABL902_09270 [Gallionella sp.]